MRTNLASAFRLAYIASFLLTLAACDIVEEIGKQQEREKYGCCKDASKQEAYWYCTSEEKACTSRDQEKVPMTQCPEERQISCGHDAAFSFSLESARRYAALNPFEAAMFEIQDPTRTCSAQCAEGVSNASCFIASPNSERQASLAELYSAVSKAAKRSVTAAELRQMFDVTGDPCGRGDVQFSDDGLLSNSGETSCVIASQVNSRNEAKLWVPKDLHARWRSTSEGAMRIDFDDGDAAPVLEYWLKDTKNSGLTEQFGGTVRYVEATNSALFLRVDRGCVGVAF
jgi:hypothetical protein